MELIQLSMLILAHIRYLFVSLTASHLVPTFRVAIILFTSLPVSLSSLNTSNIIHTLLGANFLQPNVFLYANIDQQYSYTGCFYYRHHLIDHKNPKYWTIQTKNQIYDATEEIYHSLLGPDRTCYQKQVGHVHPVLQESSDQSNSIT